jgi:hypothetical protein
MQTQRNLISEWMVQIRVENNMAKSTTPSKTNPVGMDSSYWNTHTAYGIAKPMVTPKAVQKKVTVKKPVKKVVKKVVKKAVKK